MKAFRKFAWLLMLILLMVIEFGANVSKQVNASIYMPTITIYKSETTTDLPPDVYFSHEYSAADIINPNSGVSRGIPGVIYELKLIRKYQGYSGPNSLTDFMSNLTIPDPNDNFPMYAVTNEEGIASFSLSVIRLEESQEYYAGGSLAYGEYSLREIALSEYDDVKQYMNQVYGESTNLNPPSNLVPNTKSYRLYLPFYINDTDSKIDLYIRAKNVVGQGSIRIEKDLRANPLNETLTVQPNIRFKLYDSNYTEITTIPATGAPMGELVTDSNGRLTIAGLALGATYYLKEVAPTGTIPENLGYRKFIASTLDADTLSIDNTTTQNNTGRFINNTITKRVSTDEGQTFEKESVVSTEKPYLYQIAARVPDKGEGTLEEFKLVDKMQKVEDQYYTYFQSNTDLNTLTDLTVKVNGTELAKEKYTVHIADTDKQAVANQGKETKVIGFTLTFNNPADLHAGDKIELRLKGVLINETITKETRTVYPNEVKEQVSTKHKDGTEDHYVISDVANVRTEKGYFEIIKEEATTNKRLANAEFTLYRGKAPASLADVKPADKVVEGLVTDENGAYKSKTDTTHTYTVDGKTLKLADGLSLGEYYLVETSAPTGHKRITTPIALEIKKNEQGNVVVKTITNEVQYWNVPDTGGVGTQYFLLIGLMSVTTFAVWYLYKEKSRTNEK